MSAEAEPVYQASQIKRGPRSTKAQVTNRRRVFLDIIAEMHPMTVRSVYYQASVRGVIEKTEHGYDKVQNDLTLMRRAGTLPYSCIADNTRWQRRLATFGNVEEALKNTAKLYRKSLWRDANVYCELWCEKDALAGVLCPVTELYDVPLMVARGYSSLSFLHSAAEAISELEVPAFIYHVGDFDPSGVDAAEKIEQTLREMAPEAEIHFERLAVTIEQIERWNLPTRPTKAKDPRAKKFNNPLSVELDAIRPDTLRDIVREAIERHLPAVELAILKVAEDSEREIITSMVEKITRPPPPTNYADGVTGA